jgi:hypothetical protein
MSIEKLDRTKIKEMNFWVIGRRKFKRIALTDMGNQLINEWNCLGDFYVCFHDSCEEILLELAFDIGFSKSSI